MAKHFRFAIDKSFDMAQIIHIGNVMSSAIRHNCHRKFVNLMQFQYAFAFLIHCGLVTENELVMSRLVCLVHGFSIIFFSHFVLCCHCRYFACVFYFSRIVVVQYVQHHRECTIFSQSFCMESKKNANAWEDSQSNKSGKCENRSFFPSICWFFRVFFCYSTQIVDLFHMRYALISIAQAMKIVRIRMKWPKTLNVKVNKFMRQAK